MLETNLKEIDIDELETLSKATGVSDEEIEVYEEIVPNNISSSDMEVGKNE